MPYNEMELASILTELRRPFQTTRDPMMDRWRAVRHRRLKPWLPKALEGFVAQDIENIMFRDPLPEFVINRIKQRLGANQMTISVRPPGDIGPKLERMYEDLEDAFNGIAETLDPIGAVDGRVREHQAADGKGWYELEFLPKWVPSGDEAKDKLSRQQYGLPVCLSAPDPRSLYPGKGFNGRLLMVAKVVDVPLIDVRNNWSKEGFKLAWEGDHANGRVVKSDLIPLMPVNTSPTVVEYGKTVRLVRFADSYNIYDCCYSQPVAGGQLGDDVSGSTPQLILLATYPNPIGRPPFYAASARSTSDPNPGYEDYPLALEILETAPFVSQVRTIEIINAMIESMLPWHVRRTNPDNSNAAPSKPPELGKGFYEMDGVIGLIPTNQHDNLDKLDSTLSGLYNAYNTSIMGALQAGLVGKTTPAWTLMQMNEEQVSLLQEALDQRAIAFKEVLLDVRRYIKNHHLNDGSIYVNAERRQKNVEAGRAGALMELNHDLLALENFKLSVTIEAMTQSQRAADTEYWRRIWIEGRISDETYDEHLGIQDRVEEQARLDRQAISKPMRQMARSVAMELAKVKLRPLYGSVVDTVLGPSLLPSEENTAPTEMETNEPADEEPAYPIMPGQGMSIQQPELQVRNGLGPQ